MRTLLAVTEDFIKTERTELAADAAAGSNVSLTLLNNGGFTNSAFVVIGYEGNELCEMEQINQAPSGNTSIRVATLKFNHQKGEPVTVYRYDKRKFYGATSATGSFAELTADGSPLPIQVDDPTGTIIEYTGIEGYTYFKATYYNSTTTDETSQDDSDAVLANESVRYASLYAIRKHAGLAGNPRYSESRLETKRKQAENEINSAIAAKYVLPLSEVPHLVSQICELLAAGYIDYEEFGKNGEGVKWLGEGRALLKAIQKGTQLLIGTDGTELARNTKVGVLDGYPNDEDTDSAQFSMSDRY
jgi:phage gp36-like protein